jgi:DivIVA domain-containing protein
MSHVRFRRVSRLRRGYSPRQVDAFLDGIEVALRGGLPLPSATEVRQAGFEMVHHGYDTTEVDAALDHVEERVLDAQAATAGRRGRVDAAGDAAYLREQLLAPYMHRFPRAGGLRRGYDIDDVDEMVDRLVASLDGGPAVSVDDLRTAPFRSRRGGYREDAVDDMLDRAIEVWLLANRQDDRGRPQG